LSSIPAVGGVEEPPISVTGTSRVEVATQFALVFFGFMEFVQYHLSFRGHVVEIQLLQPICALRISIVQYPFGTGVGEISIMAGLSF
jgi:hypothetical protein